ncbi:hypothetical protein GQ53DRAFT_425326 [Thozetella sp. PMI_491]|nr:hypothetical protein GQ53DRAFT_425326 [Thozetella sp. PMI_491]
MIILSPLRHSVIIVARGKVGNGPLTGGRQSRGCIPGHTPLRSHPGIRSKLLKIARVVLCTPCTSFRRLRRDWPQDPGWSLAACGAGALGAPKGKRKGVSVIRNLGPAEVGAECRSGLGETDSGCRSREGDQTGRRAKLSLPLIPLRHESGVTVEVTGSAAVMQRISLRAKTFRLRVPGDRCIVHRVNSSPCMQFARNYSVQQVQSSKSSTPNRQAGTTGASRALGWRRAHPLPPDSAEVQ